ncbi:hypothetical protein FD723_18440 [Nostoc sp. C052]|uniref:hypothetical protein n=1 Tax=Nostoc sp. C052 TaxID=2576902 RepID=UPI001C4BB789|nr:hypothetical protein [Nostoc sp. C052]QLE42203.1 hypothetical protein FD723_18440 [Nostoc sp. C052]
MSAFNPNSRQLTPQEWQAIASDSIEDNSSQYFIIGGIVLGLFAASATGFPPTGLLIAGWGFYSAWQRTKQANRNEVAINNYKCVAHILEGDNFLDFRHQVGDAEVLRQIQWATEREYKLSNDALDFIEIREDTTSGVSSRPISHLPAPPASIPSPAITQTQALTATSYYTPPSRQEFDVMGEMVGKAIKNQLIVGIQGAGKGIVISNALAAVQKYHPNRKIFVIDPKGKAEESGYWEGRADYLERAKIIEMEPHEVVAWVKGCFDLYMKVPGECLLFLDEGTAVASSFKSTRGAMAWLKNKIAHFVSLGDGDGRNFWMAVQNGDTSDLGISGGMRSQLNPYVIINPAQMSAYESVINLELLPKDKKPTSEAIKEIAKRSPVGRALFHGAINEWLPMPQMENYSGFDRDSRTFINPAKNQTELLIQKLQQSNKNSLDSFILEDLGITGDKKERMRQGILEAIALHNRNDLLQKFTS